MFLCAVSQVSPPPFLSLLSLSLYSLYLNWKILSMTIEQIVFGCFLITLIVVPYIVMNIIPMEGGMSWLYFEKTNMQTSDKLKEKMLALLCIFLTWLVHLSP